MTLETQVEPVRPTDSQIRPPPPADTLIGMRFVASTECLPFEALARVRVLADNYTVKNVQVRRGRKGI